MIGETIGSYQILRQLGVGAMGQVYLAEHRYLKRKAALKLLARELVDRPELLERFFLEARATSAIEHPGIVQIFDCEVDPTGRPYIVMEYIEGDTLGALLARQRPLNPLVVARLSRSIAEALEAAHAKQIVHRDLKPDNMFVRVDPPDSIKLVDFGIAKLAGDFKAAQMHQTRTGAMMGTPLYMSPEQCRDSASIDFRTDLYSLGCVMHEMLTGRPPFLRDNLGDLVVAHLTEPPPDPRTLNPEVPELLAQVTIALLQKDPARRPANMREVAGMLLTFVSRMTTVPQGRQSTPGATPAEPAPPPAPTMSTLGDSAAEPSVDPPPEQLPRNKRAPLLIGAGLVAIAALALGATALTGKRATDKPAVVAASAAPVALPTPPPPPAAAPVVAARPTETAAHVAAAAANKHAVAPTHKDPPAVAGAAASNKKGEGKGDSASKTGGATPADHAARAALPELLPPSSTERAAPADLTGAWEGAWNDPAQKQHGRLFIQVSGGGAVAGWMFNAGAQQSYRMSGTLAAGGALALTCDCPPGQVFSVRGDLDASGDDLKGQLALSSSGGVFGHGHVRLHRTTATR